MASPDYTARAVAAFGVRLRPTCGDLCCHAFDVTGCHIANFLATQ
jgi:hypothetical protein